MSGRKDYRIRIYKYKSDWSGSTPEVEWTFDTLSGQISNLDDTIGGQRITPIDGRVESLSWKFSLLDINENVTAKLSDAEGKGDILRRIVDISKSTDGGTNWTLLTTGRITDIDLAESVAAFDFTVQDERYIERTSEIFTDALPDNGDPTDLSEISIIRGSETSSVYPAGFAEEAGGTGFAWAGFPRVDYLQYEVGNVDGNLVRLDPGLSGAVPIHGTISNDEPVGMISNLPAHLESEILDDLKSGHDSNSVRTDATEGDFENLIVHVDGTNREVLAWGIIDNDHIGSQLSGEDQTSRVIRSFYIVWPTNQPSINTLFTDVYFHMPTSEPTSALRKHLGGPQQSTKNVFRSPFQTLKEIYDELGVRYDSTAMQNLIDDQRFSGFGVAVDGPKNAADWIQKNIYSAFGVAPTFNAAGEVVPKPILQPNAEEIPDVTTLTEITADKASTHPTFQNTTRELATVVKIEKNGPVGLGYLGKRATTRDRDKLPDNIPFDMVRYGTKTAEFESDNIDRLGRHVHTIEMDGTTPFGTGFNEHVARGILFRYASGAIHTELRGLDSLSSIDEGDYVIVNISSYPNLDNQARGGARLMQVLTRSHGHTGPTLTLLDAGPQLQPLDKLTISAAQNTNNPTNAIDVSISGLATGATWILQAAESDTEPASSSNLWQTIESGTSTGTQVIDGLASDTTYYFRARQMKDKRVGSLWSDAAFASTAALTAPSNLQTQNVQGCSAQIIWTNGDSEADIEVFLDGTKRRTLSAGTTFHFLKYLTTSTTYTVGVRHIGPQQGVTSTTSIDFTTDSTPEVGPPTLGIVILSGQETNS
jgi:hypothetical protein